MRELTTYFICYTDKTGYDDAFEAYGSKQSCDALKWLHSADVKATYIQIYKHGKDFENNHDDIIPVHQQYWK